jgi:hypothetical protein
MVKCIIGVEQEPRIQFTIEADPDNMPDIIKFNYDTYMLVGRYASQGNNYHYRRVTNIYNFEGPAREWIQYSGLKG